MIRESHRQWVVFGIHVTVQTVALVFAVLALATLIGFAVLEWLESTV